MANFHWIVVVLLVFAHGVLSSFLALPKKPLVLSSSKQSTTSNSLVATTKVPKKQLLPGNLFGLPSIFFPTVLEMTGGPLSKIVYILLYMVNEDFAGKFMIDFLSGYTSTWVFVNIARSIFIHVMKHGFFQFWRKSNDSNEKVNRITNDILQKSDVLDENVSVHIVKTKELKDNAATTSSLDSSVIVVHESYLKNEAALSAVLAHEAGHIKARDVKNGVADLATVGGYGFAFRSACDLYRGFAEEERHIKWAMEKLKDNTRTPPTTFKRGLRWAVMKSEETIPGLPNMLKQNTKNQIQSGLYAAFLALPFRLSSAKMSAKSRKAEFIADAHAVKLCGPIPVISVLRPELIGIFITTAQLFYYTTVAILSYVNVPASLLIFCVGWSGWIDFSRPLQLMNGSQLRRCFQATGLLKKQDKPRSWLNTALDWLLNDSTHPGTDERIEAILSRME